MIQMVSTPLELSCLLLAAAIAVLSVRAAVAVARGRQTAPSLRICGAAAALYVALLLGAGAVARDRFVSPGTALCFDDWCAALTGAKVADTSAHDRTIEADLRISSIAKRVTMRPSGSRVEFLGATGTWYAANSVAGEREYYSRIAPGEAFTTRVQAIVPRTERITAARICETGWIGAVIPFEECSPLYRKTLYAIAL